MNVKRQWGLIVKKYRRHVRSKFLFPTHVLRTSAGKGGQHVPGHVKALEDIMAGMKRKMGQIVTRHTRGQWVFLEVRGV